MHNQLFLLSGPPACGKTTWLKEHGNEGYVVSRDAIRFAMLKDGEDYFAHETEVFEELVRQTQNSIDNNWITYVDATHLNWAGRRKLLKRLNLDEVDVSVIEFHTPLKVCLERNAKREGRARVPDSAIIRMYKAQTSAKDDPFYYFQIKKVVYNE